MNEIKEIVLSLNGYKEVVSNVNRVNKLLLENDFDVLEVFDDLLKLGKEEIFILMTLIVKKRQLYTRDCFAVYEKWLYDYVDSWGKCDAYCYRVINPMIERYTDLFEHIICWSNSKLVYVRRASLVCFIISKQDFIVDYPIDKIFFICNRLKEDKHIHIEKALGWVLKYAYLTYPLEVVQYLKDNVSILSRTTFRYALEKMPKNLKDSMMQL